MNMSKVLNKIAVTLLLIIVASCGSNSQSEHSDDEKLKVLSSFTVISDMIKQIGQERVEVHNLVPIGMAPHEYESKPNDIKFAATADLIFYNGLNLEGGEFGWMMKLIKSIKTDQDKVIEVAKDIDPIYLKDEKGMREVNPHAFISPKVGIVMVGAIRDALMEADVEHENYYNENAAIYIRKLEDVDRAYDEKISKIPEQRRVLFASELAFQYMAQAYGLKEGYIWAIDTDNSGTPNQIKNAISFINKYKPPVLFVESNVDRRPIMTVSDATGVRVYEKPILSDELGRPGNGGDTYIGFLEYNLEQIYEGLK